MSANSIIPSALLLKYQNSFVPVLPIDLNASTVCRLDFTAHNSLLANQILTNTGQFNFIITQMLQEKGASIGVGGYLEDRIIYRRSALFTENQKDRRIHLGVDVWAPAGTPVLTPLAGVVHSFADNAHFGDYGPTIILQHSLENYSFYTLYGHLSRSSLTNLQVGQAIDKNQQFSSIGTYPENGDWPPHLHFQIITDMQGRYGDFPGVCSRDEKAAFAQICLDPNLILQSQYLAAF
ncbi:peptidoglycan DD-metalloendopeptidase family protein [Adhaeribacter radiodurans]|uniref:Peptidoglycan DD-metalloendopeptidase family protein n=1 Tax=Adhaeribacter radiodurans TaxID=2745197 RepID=A0A7L7L9W2_9BACT|nr:peptidoglycan DD-metalloendopeptidase family protein [Adhaeribacter radiodurans]QMU29189.1 peptidoglycan DD-metalloendopeptidase family protein [Adhaeribacter radiodurans]